MSEKQKVEVRGIYGIREYEAGGEKKAKWTLIGRAFVNRDDSLNLSFDYIPTGNIQIQVRPFFERKDEGGDE